MNMNVMIMSGPDDGREIVLMADEEHDYPDAVAAFTIGRRETCDICIPFDTSVSRLHAQLVLHPDQNISLIDEKSRNGTFIGRQRVKDIEPVIIGQLFRIGNTWLRIQSVVGEENE